MAHKTSEALKWIANILNGNNIPYRVGGGLATSLYGSGRPVNDIDISMPGKFFPVIMPFVQEHIITGPKHYLNEKWDCVTLSLNFNGQEIDMTDVDTLLMKNKEGTQWIKNKSIYEKHPNIIKEVEGVQVKLMHPLVLLEYKEHLSGEHQEFDRKFLREYILTHHA